MDTKLTDLKGHTPAAPANATHPSTPGKDAAAPSQPSGPIGHERQGTAAERPDVRTTPAPTPNPNFKSDVASEPPKEERATRPRALRAISPDGNVLKTTDWILKRDPTTEEKDAFLRTVPRATAVDVVDSKL